jgi:hypothetical protein
MSVTAAYDPNEIDLLPFPDKSLKIPKRTLQRDLMPGYAKTNALIYGYWQYNKNEV